MMTFLYRIGRFMARAFLTLLAFVFVALIAIQIVLIAGINFMSAGFGTDFIEKRANLALAESGYQVAFDGLYYDPLRGFTIHNLSVADAQGAFLTLDRLSAGFSITRSALRTLDLSIHGGTLSLDRLPVADDAAVEPAQPLEPFATPDIYFRTIILSRLSFDHVALGEAVAGAAYHFSPSLEGKASLDEVIGIALTLAPGLPELAPHLPAPDTITMTWSFAPSTLDVMLDELRVTAMAYDVTARGQAALAGDGRLTLAIEAKHDDLQALTQNNIHSANAQITLDGPLKGPALDLNALIIPGTLKDRGLSDITIAVKTADISQGMTGNAHIATTIREQPVTVDAQLSYAAPRLQITDMKGTAPSLTLTGNGVLDTDTTLFNGVVTLDAADLKPYGELAGITLAGAMKAAITLKPSDIGAQSAAIDATLTNGAYDDITVKKLSLNAALASLATPWPQSATLDATALRITPDVTVDRVKVTITEAGAEQYKLSLTGNGNVPAAVTFDGSASLSNLTQAVPTARDIALTLSQGKSSAKLTGDFSPESLDLKITTPSLRGRDIPADLPPALDDARIDLSASMTGTPAAPRTEATLTLGNLGAGAYQNASLTATATHDGQTVAATLTGQGTGIRTLAADASFPMTLALLPFQFSFDQNAALNGTVKADIDLAAITPLFLPPTQSLSGTLVADGTLGGTVANPTPNASLRLSGAAFEDDASGITIADLVAAATLTRDQITLTSLSATDGKEGTLSGNGALSFGSGATTIALTMKNFNAPRTDLADGVISADLALKGSAEGLHLSGTADIAEMQVLIPETFQSRIPQLNIVEDDKDEGPSLLDKLTLDIAIDAHNQIFVRGWGLDAEFGGTITVGGTGAQPQFNGTLESRRGRFEEFGKRFTLARANLRFQGSIPPSPYLDIEATTPAGDVTGSILFTGPVTAPSIKFASTPSLPEDEVLSRILFGRDSARISPFQAVQLAQTIARFSGQGGGGGLDPLGMLRSATGLDDISVEMDESGAANVDVGKYLTDNVYLELSKGKGENSGAATIQIEVTPSINVESRIGQDAQGGGGVFWKHDY